MIIRYNFKATKYIYCNMKIKYLLMFAILILLKMQSYGQTYISQKQSYYEKNNCIYVTGEKVVKINGNNFELDLPNQTEKYTGTFSSIKNETQNGEKIKVYYIDGGGLIVLRKDQILANLYATKFETSINYFLANYIEPTETEKLAIKKKNEEQVAKNIFESDKKIMGELTAQCIRDKKVRIGMIDEALPLILGSAKKINTTETATGKHKQFVYDKMYIYSENGIVTAIQTEE